MDIYFKTKALQKICENHESAKKKLGDIMARKLGRRMMELWAAENLSDIASLPGARVHELTGDRKGQLSVDLKHPYRLLFLPANIPLPLKEDGGLDWSAVTEIEIIEIVDTH